MTNQVNTIAELTNTTVSLTLSKAERYGKVFFTNTAGAMLAYEGDQGALKEGDIKLVIRRVTSGTLFACEGDRPVFAIFDNGDSCTVKMTRDDIRAKRIDATGRLVAIAADANVSDEDLADLFDWS